MLSKKLTIDKIPHLIKGARILMRVDYNVPLSNGKVADPTRITSTIPTIKFLQEHGARSITLMTHLGRPKGQRLDKYSLEPIVPDLEDFLEQKISFLNDCVGKAIESDCHAVKDGKITLLENVRFHLAEEGKGEKDGQKVKATTDEIFKFRESLTRIGDLYINDAFGTSHRDHSSMTGVGVETRAAGFLLKKELDYFSKVLEDPTRPLTMILGGAKVADKIQLIMNMLDKADEIIIGGGMAFTFNSVINNTPIGNSLFDEAGAKLVPDILAKARSKKCNIHIPSDFVCSDRIDGTGDIVFRTEKEGIDDGLIGLDIGEET